MRSSRDRDKLELKLSDRLALERTAGSRPKYAGRGANLFKLYRVWIRDLPSAAVLAGAFFGDIYATSDTEEFRHVHVTRGNRPLYIMMIQYYRTLKRIGTELNVVSNPCFQMAFAAALLGTVLLATFTLNILLRLKKAAPPSEGKRTVTGAVRYRECK